MQRLKRHQFGLATVVTIVTFAAIVFAASRLSIPTGSLVFLPAGGIWIGRVVGARLGRSVLRNRTLGGVVGGIAALMLSFSLHFVADPHFYNVDGNVPLSILTSVLFGSLLGVATEVCVLQLRRRRLQAIGRRV